MLDPTTMQYLMTTLVALALTGVVYALIYPYVSGDRQKDKRVSAVADSRSRKPGVSNSAEAQANRKKNVSDSLKEIEIRQKAKEKITMRLRLQRAGLTITPRDFYMMSAMSGVIMGGAAYAAFGLAPEVALVVAFVGSFGFPRLVLNKMTKRRQHKFLTELANAIDVIVRGIKTGLPLNECLQILARESPEPLASEFREVVDQQRMGVTLGECLERMGDRMPLAEIRFLTIVISIQQQAGGNLSEALSNLSGVLRDRFMLSMKVKALSAEAKASAIVLASLPPGVMCMVYLSSPNYIMPLFTTQTGNFLVAFGGVWMLTGILIMRKMINFKF